MRTVVLSVLLVLAALLPAGTEARTTRHLSPRYGPSVLRWAPAIRYASRHTGIGAPIIAAVITVESGGQPSVVSSAGAIGLMQLEPATAAAMGVNPWIPGQNVLGGSRYLAYLLRRCAGGNLTTALAMYNGGPANPQYGYAALVYAHLYR